MIVAINRLQVPATYADHLEQAFGKTRGMDGVPGCTGFECLRNEDGGEYLVVTRWIDRLSYESWLSSDAFQRVHSQANPDSPVKTELSLYEVLT